MVINFCLFLRIGASVGRFDFKDSLFLPHIQLSVHASLLPLLDSDSCLTHDSLSRIPISGVVSLHADRIHVKYVLSLLVLRIVLSIAHPCQRRNFLELKASTQLY